MRRWYLVVLAFFVGSLMVQAALTEDELEDLKDYVNVSAINDDTYKDDNDVKYFELTFRTNQRNDYKYTFAAKVFVELEDKKTKTVCHVQALKQKAGGSGSQYTGTDRWRVWVPYGDMHRPKMKACVIQYGVMDTKDGKPVFVPIAEDFDDVDTIKELLKRTPELADAKVIFQHQYETERKGETYSSDWE